MSWAERGRRQRQSYPAHNNSRGPRYRSRSQRWATPPRPTVRRPRTPSRSPPQRARQPWVQQNNNRYKRPRQRGYDYDWEDRGRHQERDHQAPPPWKERRTAGSRYRDDWDAGPAPPAPEEDEEEEGAGEDYGGQRWGSPEGYDERQRRSPSRARTDDDEAGSGSSSSSSSSSDEEEDWRQKVWRQGYQGFPCMPMLVNPYRWQQQQLYGAAQQQQYGMPMMAGHMDAAQMQWRQDWGQQQHADWGQQQGALPAPPPRKRPRGDTTRGRGNWPKHDRWHGPEDGRGRDEPPEMIPAMLEPLKEAVIDVPKSYIAKVIGKQGAQIRVIRQASGAQIDARQQTTDPCHVKVVGTVEAIEKARDMIWDLIEVAELRFGTLLEIPRAKIGKVIGIRGAQINEIQVKTGAKVDVDKNCDPCKVMIGGEDDKIEAARKIILTLAMEATDGESEYLDLPKAATGAILGVGGKRLRDLQSSSGARIDVDKTQPSMCRVRIAGSPEEIETAKQLVLLAAESPREMSLLEEDAATQNSCKVERMSLPAGTAGKVIGRGGSTIQALQTESGARLWVDPEASEVQISGQEEAVTLAKALIQAVLTDGAPASLVGAAAAAAPGAEGWTGPAAEDGFTFEDPDASLAGCGGPAHSLGLTAAVAQTAPPQQLFQPPAGLAMTPSWRPAGFAAPNAAMRFMPPRPTSQLIVHG